MTAEDIKKAEELKKTTDEAKKKLELCSNIDPRGRPEYEPEDYRWRQSIAGLTIDERRMVKTLIRSLLEDRYEKAVKALEEFHA